MYECEEITAEPTQMWSNNRHCCTGGNCSIGCISSEGEYVGACLGCCTIGAGNHAET
jgi:hypothetical protein